MLVLKVLKRLPIKENKSIPERLSDGKIMLVLLRFAIYRFYLNIRKMIKNLANSKIE